MLSAPAITDDFDWANNPDIVARHQDAIACYENLNGDVVIRREQSWCEDEDTIIVINKAHVPALVQALIDTAGLEAESVEHAQLPPPAKADTTAAERQRRYRHRHRNGGADRNDRYVTPSRHAETLDLEVSEQAAS
jgi:hypothetical protein